MMAWRDPVQIGAQPAAVTVPVSSEAQAAAHWLLETGRFARDSGELLDGFSRKLVALGVPLTRATTHARTLHPQFGWVMREWLRGGLVEVRRRSHGVEETPIFRGNPVQHVVTTGKWLNSRLDARDTARFPVLRDLQRGGFTHYLMAPLRMPDGMAAASWATNAAGGFSVRHVALLHEMAGLFALVFEARGLRSAAADLLSTYVGHDPGRRILEGSIQRGDVHRLDAAIMLTDLRGFGRLSDEMTEEQIVGLLNGYFDCVVPQVTAEGGEVLKFIGDGVLAVFGADRHDARPCNAAYRAARAALAELARRNAAGGIGGVKLAMGIALHCGQVAYGNIGSGDRLDFTAIGRDVNVASRLERLCEPLGRPLLMTSAFVAGIDAAVVEVGQFQFKGFKDDARVFAPAGDVGAAPC